MQKYLDLLRDVLDTGDRKESRTGVATLSVPGAMLRFDLQYGFPAVTTKKLAFKAAVGELCGFLRGFRSAADFRAFGCKVWDANANENEAWLNNPFRAGQDDLGPVYGVQWRRFDAFKRIDVRDPKAGQRIAAARAQGFAFAPEQSRNGALLHKQVDQIRECLDAIVHNPDSRRILFHAWNPAQLDEMALPPCHLLYQFLPNKAARELSMVLYLRSSDLFLGLPFNIAEASILMHLMGRLGGYKPKWLTVQIGDAHIYETHLEAVREQLQRQPFPLPQLKVSDRIPMQAKTQQYDPSWLDRVEPADFALEGYVSHPALLAPMAV